MFNIFKTNANEKRQLVERAQILGKFLAHSNEVTTEGIIRILDCVAESQLSKSTKMLDSKTESKLFAEMLSFHIHVADRLAVEKLSTEKRGIFIVALLLATQEAAAKCKKADFTIQEISLFTASFEAFDLEHSKFPFYEGDGRYGPLFWEFSKRLSSMAHLQKEPIQEPVHVLTIQNLIMRSIVRLCLPTLMDTKKTLDDWSEDLKNAEKMLANPSKEFPKC